MDNHLFGNILKWALPIDKHASTFPFNYEISYFIEELEKRGYDITTIKFSIELKNGDINYENTNT